MVDKSQQQYFFKLGDTARGVAGTLTALSYPPAHCMVTLSVKITLDPYNSSAIWMTNLSSNILEVEYSSLTPAGNASSHRYVHLEGNESRWMLRVGTDECVTDEASTWSRGPSGKPHLKLGKGSNSWFVDNTSNHFIALHMDVNGGIHAFDKAAVTAPANKGAGVMPPGAAAWSDMAVPPGRTNIWPIVGDKVEIAYSFEDVFPYSKP